MVEQLERRGVFTRAQQDYLKALYLLGGDERPVPTRAGKVRPVSHRSLGESRAGEKLVVQGVSDDDPQKLRELERRGLMPGTRIAVVAGSEFEGPIEVRIKGRRESVPLGLARAIFVAEAPPTPQHIH